MERFIMENLYAPLATTMIADLEQPIHRGLIQKKQNYDYIASPIVINQMNKVFGYGQWSKTILDCRVIAEFATSTENVKKGFCVVAQSTVRVTLSNGSFYDDVATGTAMMGVGNKGQIYDKALKESSTNALKRACRHLGEQFGNSLYLDDGLAYVGSYIGASANKQVEEEREILKEENSKHDENLAKNKVKIIKGIELYLKEDKEQKKVKYIKTLLVRDEDLGLALTNSEVLDRVKNPTIDELKKFLSLLQLIKRNQEKAQLEKKEQGGKK